MTTDDKQKRSENRPLLAQLREDYEKHGYRAWNRPGFHAVAVYRLGVWYGRRPKPARLLFGALYNSLYFVTRNLYGIELPRDTKVGRRLVVGHQGGIVIGHGVEIGDDCVIRQNVTIGIEKPGGSSPKIGDRVDIGAGAVMIGDIVVGDDVLVGPNAVVTMDVPAGASVLAPPARILRASDSNVSDDNGSRPARDLAQRQNAALAPSIDDLIALIQGVLDLQEPLDRDTPLVSSGLIDSLNIATLVAAIEEEFGVDVAGSEIDAESLDTPSQILDVIASRAPRE